MNFHWIFECRNWTSAEGNIVLVVLKCEFHIFNRIFQNLADYSFHQSIKSTTQGRISLLWMWEDKWNQKIKREAKLHYHIQSEAYGFDFWKESWYGFSLYRIFEYRFHTFSSHYCIISKVRIDCQYFIWINVEFSILSWYSVVFLFPSLSNRKFVIKRA